MSEPKKPQDFDPDKTVVDVRKPERPDEPEQVATSRPSPPPPKPEESERTVVISRPSAAPPAPEDADRTVLVSRTSAARGPVDAERTIMTPTGGGATAPAGPVQFVLACLSGRDRGRRFPVAGEEVLVGSSPSCQIVLAGAETLHAKLKKTGDTYELQNVGSSGSIIAHRRPVTQVTLKNGDLVKIGEQVFRFARSGEVFSSEYSEEDVQPATGVGRFFDVEFLKERPLVVGAAAVVLVLAVMLLWPSSAPPPPPEPSSAAPARNTERAKEVDALLVAGELLFGEGRYVAPPDRPDEENAYAKFNEALALDPGNEKARDWLKRIDVKLEESRRLREETERRRREAEEAKLAAERARLQAKIDAVVAVGDGLFDAGKVAEPAGNNALARYEEALKLDPENAVVQERIRRAVFHYVQIGDDFRDKGDNWRALEQYRKGQRAAQRAHLKDADVNARVTEVEKVLKSGMASSQNYLILYKDDRGQLHVLDEMEKVPAKYRDRAVEVQPAPTPAP